jgi:hypothetical protein
MQATRRRTQEARDLQLSSIASGPSSRRTLAPRRRREGRGRNRNGNPPRGCRGGIGARGLGFRLRLVAHAQMTDGVSGHHVSLRFALRTEAPTDDSVDYHPFASLTNGQHHCVIKFSTSKKIGLSDLLF